MLWMLTLLSLVGVVLNIKKKRICFIIWAITNLSWAIVDFKANLPAQGGIIPGLFFVWLCGDLLSGKRRMDRGENLLLYIM